MEHPVEIKNAVKKYFQHSMARWPLGGTKNLLDKKITNFMIVSNLRRFRHNGACIDFVERTTCRLDIKAIPLEIKQTYAVTLCSRLLVPFDNDSQTFRMPSISEEIDEDESIEEDCSYIETHDEMAIMVKEFVSVKEQWKYHDEICKETKDFIINYMNSNNLEEIEIDGNKLSFIKRFSKRCLPSKLPADIRQNYMIKTKGFSKSIYTEQQEKAVEIREELDGTAKLRQLKLESKIQLIIIDD